MQAPEGPRTPVAVLRRPDGLELFYASAGKDENDHPVAVRVGRDLKPGTAVLSPVFGFGPVAPTPDDRRFLWADNIPGGALQYLEHREDGGIDVVGAHQPGGQPRGIAVDSRGERAWVLLGGVNRIAVIQ